MAAVLIVGASRGLGLETVKRALQAGHEVQALARSADKIAIDHPQLHKVSASVLDPGVLEGSLPAIDVVITVLGLAPTASPVRLFSDTAAAVTKAMQRHGVKRLIAVTGMGAGPTRRLGGFLYSQILRPVFLHTIYEDKDREEAIIQESGLDWTIVRPGFLTRLPPRGRYRVLTDPLDWESGFISRGDVADYLVRQIDDRSEVHKTPLLIG